MGRVKEWLLGMQGDAEHMTRDEWIAKHGKDYVDVYDGSHDADDKEITDAYDT